QKVDQRQRSEHARSDRPDRAKPLRLRGGPERSPRESRVIACVRQIGGVVPSRVLPPGGIMIGAAFRAGQRAPRNLLVTSRTDLWSLPSHPYLSHVTRHTSLSQKLE